MTPAFDRSGSSPIILSDNDSTAWDRFVDSRLDASAYHLSNWRGVFERAFGHRTEYLRAERNGDVVGVLPLVELRSRLFGRFMVSLPFVNYGGVVAADDGAARALFERAAEIAHAHRLRYVELRHLTQRFSDAPAKRHKVTMLLPLEADNGKMWQALDRKVRNQVRKAEKSGLTVQIGGRELIDEFYRVFSTNMRDLGTPVYAKRFFAEVCDTFPERTTLFVVRKDRRCVAAGIGFHYRDRFEMPWASSLKAYRAFCGNNLLYWTAIKHAAAIGCRIFDFGRSTPDEGTFHFKEQWGARPQTLCWEYRLLAGDTVPNQSPKNPKFALAIQMWKRLPVSVAAILGPPIVRSIP